MSTATTHLAWARQIGAGLLIGVIALVTTTSFVSLVFIGPLAPYLDVGLAMALFGAALFAIWGGFAGSLKPLWWGNQSPTIVMVSVAAGGIAGTLGDGDPAVLFATVVAFIVVSTFLSGLVLFVLGRLGQAQSAKFIPYPVVGGFLAATGILLILRGAQLVLNESVALPALFSPEPLMDWLPYAASGLALTLLARRIGYTRALLSGIVLFTGGFYAWLFASGLDVTEAGARGLLLGESPQPVHALDLSLLPDLRLAAPMAILDEVPTLVALVGLSVLALVMNATGIEIDRRTSFSLNTDMMRAGQANMVAALGGAFVGFHSVSMQRAERSLVPESSVLVNLGGAAVCIAALFGALSFIAFLPVGLFAMILSLIGFELMLRWLVEGVRVMPRGDYAIMLGILAVTLVFDFATAILIGTIAAALLFTVAYSRIRVIRSAVTARIRRSGTERSERETRILAREGDAIRVFELQNYLFFGSANGLFDRISQSLMTAEPRASHLVLDFRRTAGMDVSTAFVLVRLAERARSLGAQVIFTSVGQVTLERLHTAGLSRDVAIFPTLEEGLAMAEEALLAHHPKERRQTPLSAIAALLSEAEARGLCLIAEHRNLDAGEVLFSQDAAGDSIALIESGILKAVVQRPDGSSATVARFLAGAVVGEIAFSNRSTRTASIVAEAPGRVAIVTRASLDAAQETHPEIVADLLAEIARLLSDRLSRTTALLYALEG